MAMASNNKIDLGKYDPITRKQTVMGKLDNYLQNLTGHCFQSVKIPKNDKKDEIYNATTTTTTKKKHNNGKNESTLVEKEPKSMLLISLEAVTSKIPQLSTEINNFQGPHFTKEYRRLDEACSKYLLNLDKLDVTGVENIRVARKDAVMNVNKLNTILIGKTHDDGRPCPNCELQNI